MLNKPIISSKEFNSNWCVCVHYGDLRTFIGYSNDFASYIAVLSVFDSFVDSDLDGLFWHIQLRNKSKCIKSYTNLKNSSYDKV